MSFWLTLVTVARGQTTTAHTFRCQLSLLQVLGFLFLLPKSKVWPASSPYVTAVGATMVSWAPKAAGVQQFPAANTFGPRGFRSVWVWTLTTCKF